MKTALLSVSDKEGIAEFGKALQRLGYKILSTGGTAKTLRDNGVNVTDVSEYTGSPEIMDGRVKTLHPKIHAGLLGVRNKPAHMKDAELIGADMIDVVAVNLYPFKETVKRNASFEEAIENIDVGGPTLLRAAAKNYKDVVVICNPEKYTAVIEMLENVGVPEEYHKLLAEEVFRHTANYDAIVAGYLSSEDFPKDMCFAYEKVQDLRYGENPHQKAAFYKQPLVKVACVANAEKLQGKELSFNNIYDANSAFEHVKEYPETACVIVKHNNPCGVALGKTQLEAYEKALSTDSLSAFGGVIAFNTTVQGNVAEEIVKSFKELVIAPNFTAEALEVFSRKKKLRILKTPALNGKKSTILRMKQVTGGILVQTDDDKLTDEPLKVVTERAPSDSERKALLFAMTVCKHTKSNAIIYAKDNMTVGIGAGQMSRVDASVIGSMKAKTAGLETNGSVLASDAFFPFRDGIDAAAKAGVTAIIQPGGSIRDQEVIDACNEYGIAMLFSGVRHFNH